MDVRAKDAQSRFSIRHKRMMDRIIVASREQRLKAIQTFYNVAEPQKYNELPIERRQKIETLTDEEMIRFCKELCTEAINRDFVNYIMKGENGPVGETVYKALFFL